ncbi:CDP-diacylglycerol--serine O-phosphatidyltransferase [Campylobacter blaseri]|uniref:CDP-diacylglycerol--serine O-phosphatidyltransferase n=1 Tax=Campylobacter blaseri TaxID=2042961 RepID=A0A2P8R1K6_9BACT|nr:CDP-diacylglycerol--serine O-phosphatidyltransferase [Campylobacter blaseri]PSM52371.1 CDP-diacylglycerol--serine O-phosphatidyltransferase [Campylobacter blaseri]PSM54137.1 CDP-diacylglycerol--serine O-phosphatidyltransferase [Campylobacter blaseri]
MYIIPNLFTASSCFFGILSIVASIGGNYEKAVIYIFISLLLDGLDGRVARMTKTTSAFGIEFDSLADIIAFGAAPAILFYSVVGNSFNKFGILATGIFVVFAAIRLARFNITTQSNEPNVFIGLPLPTAAIALSVWIKIYINYDFAKEFEWIYIVGVIVLSLLMVSNIRYPSFKKINFSQTKFRQFLIISILILSILYLRPIEFFVIATTIYIFYGIIRAVLNLYTIKFKKIDKAN